MSKGKLDIQQINRLNKLLDMYYKPSELAEEVGFSVRQFYRVYMVIECPFYRDEEGSLWVNGKDFREWYKRNYQKNKLKKGEALCPRCKQVFEMTNPEKHEREDISYLLAICPHCGSKAARIISNRKKQ